MSNHYGPKIITDGLVLCLDAANTKSYLGTGTTWNDLSGNNNNGTLTNGPTFSSNNGGSIVFDGTNDRVATTSPFGDIDWATTAWSCCSFANFTEYGDRTLVNLNSATSSNYVCTNIVGYNKIYWYFVKNSTNTQNGFSTAGNNFVNAPELVYIVVTYNGSGLVTSNINFYKNGTLLTTAGGGLASITNTTSITIGGVNYPFKGNIYNFSLYNRVLSASEISQNYNALKGRLAL